MTEEYVVRVADLVEGDEGERGSRLGVEAEAAGVKVVGGEHAGEVVAEWIVADLADEAGWCSEARDGDRGVGGRAAGCGMKAGASATEATGTDETRSISASPIEMTSGM